MSATHEFALFSRDRQCIVCMYQTDQHPSSMSSSDSAEPLPFAFAVACPPEVEEFMCCVDQRLPIYIVQSDVYAGLRAAMVCGWNEGARLHGRSITVEEFAAALQSGTPWEIQKAMNHMLQNYFPWFYRLGDQPAGSEPVAWQALQAALAGMFQIAFVMALDNIL